MRYVRNTFRVLVFILVAGLLHYVLPQHDVARITSTEVIRMDFSSVNRLFFAQPDSSNTEFATRDIRLINSQKKRTWFLGFFQRESEQVMVYRNEDTGWIWPPYFKFDSSDLQAEASANMSAPAAEQWVVITHYGWRNRFFTIYPNAIGIRPVDGPDTTVVPWFNIFFFIFAGIAALFIRAMWRQFRERVIDPALGNAGDAWDKVEGHADNVGDKATGVWGRFTAWLNTWRAKK
jgi:hypothetical protein